MRTYIIILHTFLDVVKWSIGIEDQPLYVPQSHAGRLQRESISTITKTVKHGLCDYGQPLCECSIPN